jgi:superoxide dismutase, Fe-Mn family
MAPFEGGTAMKTLPIGRRRALVGMAASAVFSLAAPRILKAATKLADAYPPLPYPDNALAPVISSNTVGFHYGKHHKGYFDALTKAVEGLDLANQTLEDIVITTQINPNRAAIYNAAAQTWNHNFYWKSMKPNGGGKPSGALGDRIEQDFKGFDNCRKELAAAAVGQFGSGWAWLVETKEKKLQVMKTPNADTPMSQGLKCLLTIDVWEHAYYLDYQNRRADYVNAWLDKLANWDFAAENLSAA